MVQGYYTLEEAASILGLGAEKLSQMAQKREIRAFADRGTWRFRTQDVEEMARRLGLGSNPALQMGEGKPPSSGKLDVKPASSGKLNLAPAPSGKLGRSPASGKLTPSSAPPKPADDDLFEFELSLEGNDQLDPGASPPVAGASGGKKKDSDVHLLTDTSEGFKKPPTPSGRYQPESSGTLAFSPDDLKRKSGLHGPASSGRMAPPGSSKIRKSKLVPPAMDSGVHLVPMDEEQAGLPPAGSSTTAPIGFKDEPPPADSTIPTQELKANDLDDLDAELRKAEEAARAQKPPSKLRPKSQPQQPETSPFELSESDLELPTAPEPSRGGPTSRKSMPKVEQKAPPPPADDDEDVSLGELTLDSDFTGASGASGINLHLPADTGINLEKASPSGGGDEIEFELSLDGGEDMPGPSSGGTSTGLAKVTGDESEFELTLDDVGGLAPLSDEKRAAEAASQESTEEKDIFETDFEIPALDEESGSEAVALDESDTDLESSDFDFATAEDESGSQVVAVDEDEADENAATVARRTDEVEVDEDVTEDAEETLDEALEEDEEEIHPRRAAAAVEAGPANWGVMPAIVMIPCTIVMILMAFISFELLHGMWGYRQNYKPTSMLTRMIAVDLFGMDVPND